MADSSGAVPVANRLGALAQALADRTQNAITEATGQSASAAAALSALHHFLDEPSIELLRQVLGLTHSGAVRLVDRLEADGFVARRPGRDGRSAAVALTASGRQMGEEVTGQRQRVLMEVVGKLSARQQRHLDELAAAMLAELKRGPGALRWICRLCDTGTCGVESGDCPLAGTTFSIAENVEALEKQIHRRR